MTGGLAALAAPNGVAYITGQYDFGICKTWLAAVDMCGKPLWAYLYGDYSGGLSLAYMEGNKIVVGNNRARIFTVDANTGDVQWAVEMDTGHYVPGLAVDTALNRILAVLSWEGNAPLVVLDYNGNLIWSKRYALGPQIDEFHSVLILPDTTYVLCGWTGSVGWGGSEAYVLRINAQGDILWARILGGTREEECRLLPCRVSCALSANGKYIVWAGYTRTTDFLTPNGGNSDLLLFVLDTAGNLQWARTYGDNRIELPKQVRYLGNDKIAVIGDISTSMTNIIEEAFLLITDSLGNMRTLRRYLYSEDTDAVGLDVAPDHTLVLSLYADFPFTGDDALLLKADSTGYVSCGVDTLQWQMKDITNQINIISTYVAVFNGPSATTTFMPRFIPDNLTDSFLCMACSNLDTPKILLRPDDTLCLGETLYVEFLFDSSMYACVTRRIDQQWIFEDTVRSNSFSIGMHIAEASIHCASTTITVQDTFWILPSPVFDLPDTSICYYDSVYRQVPVGVSWLWHPPEEVSCDTCQSVWINPTKSTVFWVQAISSEGCRWIDTFRIDIDSGGIAAVLWCPEIVLADSQVRLYGVAEGVRWWWTSPDGMILTPANQQFIWVQAPDTHGEQDTFFFWTESALGCRTVDTCVIGAMELTCWDDVWIPNTFTPNGDGKNDVLYVYALNPVLIRSWQIYTRWGERVFSAENIRAGYPLRHSVVGWDGTIRGKPARPDVYVWWLEVQCGKHILFKKGDVTLIR